MTGLRLRRGLGPGLDPDPNLWGSKNQGETQSTVQVSRHRRTGRQQREDLFYPILACILYVQHSVVVFLPQKYTVRGSQGKARQQGSGVAKRGTSHWRSSASATSDLGAIRGDSPTTGAHDSPEAWTTPCRLCVCACRVRARFSGSLSILPLPLRCARSQGRIVSLLSPSCLSAYLLICLNVPDHSQCASDLPRRSAPLLPVVRIGYQTTCPGSLGRNYSATRHMRHMMVAVRRQLRVLQT